MEVATINKVQEFLSSFENEERLSSNASIISKQEESKKLLENLDFPTTRTERWKYTRVGKFIKSSYSIGSNDNSIDVTPFILEGVENYVVFINGWVNIALSQIQELPIVLQKIGDLGESSEEVFASYFNSYTDQESEIFSAINAAFSSDGMFIQASTNFDTPIQFIHLTTENEIAIQPRNLFVAEKNASVHIIQTYNNINSENSFQNSVNDIIVRENAHLTLEVLQNESNPSYQIRTDQVTQFRDSTFTINTITINGDWVRNNLNIQVQGENCTTNLNSLYLPKGKQHIDNHTKVDHVKAHCESNELYKGVLSDNSTAVFNGKVFVRQDAQKINAFQSNGNVLLSDSATINSKPELEIYADDVKCSHGSTTGQLDDDALNYLKSRGIPTEKAKKLLVSAFVGDVINEIVYQPLKEKTILLVSEKMD